MLLTRTVDCWWRNAGKDHRSKYKWRLQSIVVKVGLGTLAWALTPSGWSTPLNEDGTLPASYSSTSYPPPSLSLLLLLLLLFLLLVVHLHLATLPMLSTITDDSKFHPPSTPLVQASFSFPIHSDFIVKFIDNNWAAKMINLSFVFCEKIAYNLCSDFDSNFFIYCFNLYDLIHLFCISGLISIYIHLLLLRSFSFVLWICLIEILELP